jgi:hypothetical protein
VRWPLTCRLLAVLLLAGGAPLVAQLPTAPLPPARDTTAADSARTDSLRRLADTISTTDRLLQGERDQQVHLSPAPRCGVAPLYPGGTVKHFDRDSIDWVTAENVSDLLATVPGVFINRPDWIGTPELPTYFGRGAASVEYELDCVPQLPMGSDSVAFDPSAIPLGFLDRIDVEISPGTIRVLMFTRAHDRQAPRTKVGVAQGDRALARYFGSFERRYASGIGLSLGADYFNLGHASNGSGGVQIPSGWAQLSYLPNPRFGVQAQLLTVAPSRQLLLDNAAIPDTLLRATNTSRMDIQLRALWRQRTDGLGAALDLFAATTRGYASADSIPIDSMTGLPSTTVVDSFDRHFSVGEYGAVGSWRTPTTSAQLSAWHYTRWTPLDARLDLGWAPRDLVSAAVQLVGQAHRGDRFSQWATGRIGAQLPLGFHVEGSFSSGNRVQAPTIATDTAQHFADASVTAGFHSRPLTLDVSYLSDAGWQPQAFSEYVAIHSLAPLARTDWLTVHARYAPLGFLTFETVYQHPQHGALPDGSPPEHALSTVTLRSHFFRNFRSGIFQLKLQGILETWSPGIGGRDSVGAAIPLPGVTFFRSLIQFQIGPFIAYYDRVNWQATRTGFIPGYPIQPLGSTYGVRWEFSN